MRKSDQPDQLNDILEAPFLFLAGWFCRLFAERLRSGIVGVDHHGNGTETLTLFSRCTCFALRTAPPADLEKGTGSTNQVVSFEFF